MNKHIISTLRFQYNIYLYFNAKKKPREKNHKKYLQTIFQTLSRKGIKSPAILFR